MIHYSFELNLITQILDHQIGLYSEKMMYKVREWKALDTSAAAFSVPTVADMV